MHDSHHFVAPDIVELRAHLLFAFRNIPHKSMINSKHAEVLINEEIFPWGVCDELGG